MDDNIEIVIEKGGILKKKKKSKKPTATKTVKVKVPKQIKVKEPKPPKPVKVKVPKLIKVKEPKPPKAFKIKPFKVRQIKPIKEQSFYEKKSKDKILTDFNETINDEFKVYTKNDQKLLTDETFSQAYESAIRKLLSTGYTSSDFPSKNSIKSKIKEYNDTYVKPNIEKLNKEYFDDFENTFNDDLKRATKDNTELLTYDVFSDVYDEAYAEVTDNGKEKVDFLPLKVTYSKSKIKDYNDSIVRPNLEKIKDKAKKVIDVLKHWYYNLFKYRNDNHQISRTLIFDGNDYKGIDVYGFDFIELDDQVGYASINEIERNLANIYDDYTFLKKIEYIKELIPTEVIPYVDDLYKKYSNNIRIILDDAVDEIADEIIDDANGEIRRRRRNSMEMLGFDEFIDEYREDDI